MLRPDATQPGTLVSQVGQDTRLKADLSIGEKREVFLPIVEESVAGRVRAGELASSGIFGEIGGEDREGEHVIGR